MHAGGYAKYMSMPHSVNLSNDMYHLKRDRNKRRRDAVTFSCLGKLNAANRAVISRWSEYIEILLQKEIREKPVTKSPLVIGLTESGIIPSAIVHQLLRKQGIQAKWICSTRRPSAGISFVETHSHGPSHILPVPENHHSELWFAEDEITTGRTLLELTIKLCVLTNIRQVRFFSFADIRSLLHIKQFDSILSDYGIEYSNHSLVKVQNSGNRPPLEALLKSEPETIQASGSRSGWHLPGIRPALENQLDMRLNTSRKLHGSLLVVGEAVDIGLRLVQTNPDLSFHHVTLSPWEIDGVNIINRLDIGNGYYLYNHHNLKPPLYILNDPIDSDTGSRVLNILREKGHCVEQLELMDFYEKQ